MRLLQSAINITDTHTLIRSLQCAAQQHATARSVNTGPDSSGSIPVTSFFVGTVVYCWYVKLWCLFWNPGFESDSLLIWFPVLNFVILPFLCFVCIASSFFFQSGETKFSFFLLFWGFCGQRCRCSCVLRTFSLRSVIPVFWSESPALFIGAVAVSGAVPVSSALVSLPTHTYLSKDLGLAPKQSFISL